MPQRLPIAKLSASIVPGRSRFKSELLRFTASWPREVHYLRKIYTEIEKTATEASLFAGAEPKLRELILGVSKIAPQVANRPDVWRIAVNAKSDLDAATAFAKKANPQMADVYASYALLKLSSVLDGLTQLANKHHFAYGYDITGEVMEPGEKESRSPNLWDQANSPKNNMTKSNPANQMVDAEAETDFPELQKTKHKRVNWPARSR